VHNQTGPRLIGGYQVSKGKELGPGYISKKCGDGLNLDGGTVWETTRRRGKKLRAPPSWEGMKAIKVATSEGQLRTNEGKPGEERKSVRDITLGRRRLAEPQKGNLQ